MIEIFAWTALILGFIVAGFGTIIPGLPGSIFAVMGAIVFKFVFPEVLTWATISILIGLSVLSAVVDFLGGIFGARLGGATKAGLIGAAIGGFVGIPFGILGLVLGPFFGAIIGDMFAQRRNLVQLLKSGGGAAFGFVISLLFRLLIFVSMALVTMMGLVF